MRDVHRCFVQVEYCAESRATSDQAVGDTGRPIDPIQASLQLEPMAGEVASSRRSLGWERLPAEVDAQLQLADRPSDDQLLLTVPESHDERGFAAKLSSRRGAVVAHSIQEQGKCTHPWSALQRPAVRWSALQYRLRCRRLLLGVRGISRLQRPIVPRECWSVEHSDFRAESGVLQSRRRVRTPR
jgi:hypothetical protein